LSDEAPYISFTGIRRFVLVKAIRLTQKTRKNMTIDWRTGTWKATQDDTPCTSRVTVASDWAAFRTHEEVMRDDPLAVYGDLLPVFQSSDLNIVNVECVLGDAGAPIPKGGPNLRADAEFVKAITAVPFHIATLANNHTLDFGPDGLDETITTLQRAGVQTVGAGMSGTEAAKPLITEVNGMQLGILNCSEGEACCSIRNNPGAHGFDVVKLIKQVEQLNQQVDIVLVIFHGGRETAPMPPAYVVEGLRHLAEAGATAIVAHHPHAPQGIEVHNGVPIVYSQGNFVFWQDSPTYFQHVGYLVHLDFAGKALHGMQLTPYYIGLESLSVLQGEEKERLFADLEKVSNVLEDDDKVEQVWDAVIDLRGEERIMGAIANDLKLIEQNPIKGAARLHNLFFAPVHRAYLMNGLKRISDGRFGDSPEWAKELVRDWTTRSLS
jgi:poly-gamma-glutamate synthesis protein (capsule biosynthesis protein)